MDRSLDEELSSMKTRLAAHVETKLSGETSTYVTPNGYGGLRARVVAAVFEGLTPDARAALVENPGLLNHFEDIELVAPGEEGWYGPFTETDGTLPLWADVLAQEPASGELIFVSDLDEDVRPPITVTFYSLRGGVGRTTALANTARVLASRGHRVLCIDMDLEAPGLPVLLGLEDPPSDKGALPALIALERGDPIDIRDHVLRVSESEELYCLPAGRLDADYAERLRLLDPEIWYREAPNPLYRLLDLAATSSLTPDIILVDARTGISPISAPLLFDVSDLAVVCFFPHLQARRGTELLVRSLLNSRSRRSKDLTPEPRFLISPVPPGPSAEGVRTRALDWIETWLSEAQDRRSTLTGALVPEELTHLVSYSADLAFRDKVVGVGQSVAPYLPVADWVEQSLPQSTSPALEEDITGKDRALTELGFATGTAEHQGNFLEDYVVTRLSSQARERRFPLIIGRKGTGKTALFRWLLERQDTEGFVVPVTCPDTFRDRYPWVLGAEGFAGVEREFSSGVSWQAFWPVYTAFATAIAAPAGADFSFLPAGELKNRLTSGGRIGEYQVVAALREFLRQPDAPLVAMGWLEDFSHERPAPMMLLFDGLDTGFGNDAASRARRARAIEGLLTFVTANEARLAGVIFKVMLRYDIWQQLRFENKSHLFGRSLQLLWRDQAEYFKTILKQAMRSSAFQSLVAELAVASEVERWDDSDVFRVWNLLIGERMKGGKTTFTRNWVWNRLADGQGDHGPRALSQLFHAAVDWERTEERRNPYSRSILRPRALVPSLDVVSEEALQALLEEFSELDQLVEALRSMGRTPVDADDLVAGDVSIADIDLALEVGLLGVHEGSGEEVRRYRVPDLYRRALGMTRRGQA